MSSTNEDHTLKWSIAVFICVFDIFFVLPIQWYFRKRYLNIAQDNNAKMQKSHPDITKCLAIFAVIFTLLFHPQQAITLISPLYYNNPFLFQILTMINNCILFGIIYGAGLGGMVRAWLMCFELNLCHYRINKCWKMHINPNVMENNFWFKYQRTFGNKKYIIKRAIILFIILVAVNSTIVCYYNDIKYHKFWMIWPIFLYAIIGAYGVCLYFLTPSIPDNNAIFLKYELKWTILIPIIAVPVNALITTLYFEPMFLDKLQTFRHTFAVGVHVLSIFGYFMFHSYIMPKKFNKKEYQVINVESNSKSDENVKNLSIMQLFTNNKNKEELEGFIRFLCKEFEIENFLCFVEMYQFKYLLDYTFSVSTKLAQDRSTSVDIDDDKYRGIDDEYDYYSMNGLIDNRLIPKSHIVYNLNKHETEKHFLEIAHRLYFKYIHQNKDVLSIIKEDEELKEYCFNHQEELTVNAISKTMRKCYDEDMNMSLPDYINKMELATNKIKMKDLFRIFDPIMQCIYHSLTLSYAKHVSLV